MDKTNKEIIEQLKRLKNIQPDIAFVQNSWRLILTSPVSQPKIWFWPAKLALALTLIFLLLGAVYFTLIFNNKPTLSSNNFNSQFLTKEFDNLAINIQFQELSYYQKINQVIASALVEISQSNNHLNPQTLKNEGEKLDQLLNPPQNPSHIEELLNKIIL
ncbi:hypothetical protein COY65_02345 [Candidatus Jorgensenbacteria bacterium CG_4_10_14_0_8_um_filter_39_13]|uniref:Uncharacterized protein n=2 Tax=Candidatus Joergenseniibacteriota TaxID=1752739 RepID=A0A2M7RHF7_9BACT|nr:MAG: hypothetical protein COV54_02560 [Candidatus Jorgensenbacteria bacterium CG11_big_fil_rev_8_21_14_0_20_38_23]PIV12929.1 MAG: hypothetical protein COS46_02890 [Candidatus Jorgensenbacteria bacterium CG03_land_8_20_14_0_80_38_39]PIW97558.1 MAG: hypothetical protein COZ81_01935 [Candidatus Jorgensenbacteria bacterium CG_4_8_14_3_um_filter_38_10]PIY95796.1 MAG: hypothetical protein COY65_02345 [Candidatus Jorgensenbacteria bacterium CG_4_10_14_0_8_um_filter_39_13]PJA94741.1 MAG: hypothetica